MKNKTQLIIESVFKEAAGRLQQIEGGRAIPEMMLQIDVATGEIQIYDDRETLLAKNIVFEWAERYGRGQNPQRTALHFTGVAIAALRLARFFDSPVFDLPFAISLVDDGFNRQETLFTLDEPASQTVDDPLLKNFQQELQFFFKKLFADTNL